MTDDTVSVLFVCLGNICRSPLAEGVMRDKIAQAGLGARVRLDSCGTGAWHVGKAPDRRSIAVAAKHGVELGNLRARKVSRADFDRFDLILAMDRSNLADLIALQPEGSRADVALYLAHCEMAQTLGFDEVPDPYYGGSDGFERVYAMIDQASDRLLAKIAQQASGQPTGN